MSLPLGDMQFYDHAIPALSAGMYQIRASHEIDALADADIPDQVQQFRVQGPRFALPAGEVSSIFPPDTTNGSYATKLPHVVLSSRVLPWEIALNGVERNVPWLALLLLLESEIVGGDPQSSTRSISSTVGDVLNDKDPNVLKPAIPLNTLTSAELQSKCQTVIIDGSAFQKILPGARELPYLAHTREVNLDQKAFPLAGKNGQFSLVIDNRFPQIENVAQGINGKNIVHLVSLEGLEAYLGSQPPAIPAGKKVRLFSLASWSFFCQAEKGQTFSALAEQLAAPGSALLNRLLLKLPVDAPADTTTPAQIVQDYLARGYVGLNYEAQTGEASFALYRGPLSPELPGLIQKRQPFYSGSASTIYDARIGVFDLSLAAAWQMGRALALADQHFATRLLDFRRKGHAVIDTLHEYLAYNNLDTSASYDQLARSSLLHDTFIDLLRQDILTHIGTLAQGMFRSAQRRTRVPRAQTPPADPVAILRALLQQQETRDLLQRVTAEDLEPVAEWLARLKLLYNVPFHHLVADPQLLPAEALRFFYLDYNWVETLYDGAVSVGVQTSRDVLYQELMHGVLRDAVDLLVLQMRAKLMGKSIDPDTQPVDTDTPVAGLLIRSALVSGWPGLTIQAYQKQQALPLLRMDRPAPDVLFCLFSGIPESVTLGEPQEGIQFGVDDQGQLDLRAINGDAVGAEIGEKWKIFDVEQQRPLTAYLRPGTDRVLQILAADQREKDLLSDLQAQLKSSALTSSGFALQMISAPEQLSFT